jgi:hypothetical protein
MLYGLTLDDVRDYPHIVAKLRDLPKRIAVRVYCDVAVPIAAYVKPVEALSKVSDVLLQLVDSEDMPKISLEQCQSRATSALAHFRELVWMFEIGNEVNGDWLGHEPWLKVEQMFRTIHFGGGKTMLTLYQDEDDTWERWTLDHINAIMRNSIDVVSLSSYPHDNDNMQPNWQATFDRIGKLYPTARLMLGECGMDPSKFPERVRRNCFQLYYQKLAKIVNHERFDGGMFWWYQADFVGSHPKLWHDLEAVLR